MTNRMLAALEPLLGHWKTKLSNARFLKGPDETVKGAASISRELDGTFVVMRVSNEDERKPAETWVLSADDDHGTYTACYHDSRSVARIHQMSFKDGVLELWRQAPGASQKFTARLDEKGRTLVGEWQYSRDGVYWHRDFEVRYTKKG